MRGLVRRDLKDEDSANYRWTDDEIDRAVERAVDEFSKHHQAEQKTDVATVIGSRDMSIASLSGLIVVDAVEFPAGRWPKSFVSFSLYQTTLTMEVLGDGTDATGTGGRCILVSPIPPYRCSMKAPSPSCHRLRRAGVVAVWHEATEHRR
jgi:hypothetical protein